MDNSTSAALSESTGQRQSDRIRYAYGLHISGTDASGNSFQEDARTEVITRDGGMLLTPLALATGTRINIRRADKKAEARIVGQCGIRNEANLYGFQFTSPDHSFWELKFAEVGPTSGVGRVVLECSRCRQQEVLHLGEVEIMVFEGMRVVPRRCDKCGHETLWNEPVILGDAGVIIGSGAYEIGNRPEPRRSRTINDRKFARISMKNAKACLHRAGFADDIVTVCDLSRGGVRFLSLIDYVPGTRVDIAVPYTKDGANVFTPARIARVKCRPTADIPGEFGLEYVR